MSAESNHARPGRHELTAEAKYRLLLQISQSVSGTLDLDEILNHILEVIRGVVAYDAAGIFVLTREDPTLRRAHPQQAIAGMASRGFARRPLAQDAMLRLGQGIIGHVIRTGECVVAPDVRRNQHYVEGRRATLSEIAVPIVVHQRTIGALNLESDTIGTYSDADRDVLRFFSDAAAISIEKAMLHRQVLDRQYIKGQLQIAHDVQTRLLPLEDPALHGYDVAGLSVPTFDIGGDYYDYISLPDDRLGLVVADVAGKGIPAALIMATFRALLRTSVRRVPALPDAVREVNELLAESIGLPAFVTAVYGVLDPASGRFAYANCGHNPPLLLRAAGTVELLSSSGPCLGVFGGMKYEARETVIGPDDALVLYTDGVVELEREDGVEFGTDRLAAAVRDARDLASAEVIGTVLAATRDFTGAATFQDDVTLVVVRRHRDLG